MRNMVIELQPSCSEFRQTNLTKKLSTKGRKIAPPNQQKKQKHTKKFGYIFMLKKLKKNWNQDNSEISYMVFKIWNWWFSKIYILLPCFCGKLLYKTNQWLKMLMHVGDVWDSRFCVQNYYIILLLWQITKYCWSYFSDWFIYNFIFPIC